MMYRLEYAGHWLLKNVEPGSLFRLPGGGIALMTEYGDNNGFRHKYLLDSGESCWTDPDTEVIVLRVVEEDEESYLKPSDREYVPRAPREIPLDKVPQPNRDFAAGDTKAFDKRSDE
jgi:hypothetical protein